MSLPSLAGTCLASSPVYGGLTRCGLALGPKEQLIHNIRELDKNNITIGGLSASELLRILSEEVSHATWSIFPGYNLVRRIIGGGNSEKLKAAWEKFEQESGLNPSSNQPESCFSAFTRGLEGETLWHARLLESELEKLLGTVHLAERTISSQPRAAANEEDTGTSRASGSMRILHPYAHGRSISAASSERDLGDSDRVPTASAATHGDATPIALHVNFSRKANNSVLKAQAAGTTGRTSPDFRTSTSNICDPETTVEEAVEIMKGIFHAADANAAGANNEQTSDEV